VLPLFDSLSTDLRYAFRNMRRAAGLTAVAILSLALGMGATIAIFSVIYALALRTLPVQHPERLVEIQRGGGWNVHTYAEWKLFRDRQDIFSSVLAYNYSYTTFQIKNSQRQQEIHGVYISGGYFRTLGVAPFIGRMLQSADDQPGATPVCVISYSLWQRWYDRSPNTLGQRIRANGNEFQIVGVAPKSFFGIDIGNKAEIFLPLETELVFKDYPIRYGKQMPSVDSVAWLLSFAGRLKPGVSVGQANAGLQVLTAQLFSTLSARSDDSRWPRAAPRSLLARPMPNGTSDAWLQEMDVVLLLMVMAAVALIIACANLGNLLLARAAKRRSEIATRLALGASRWRLVRQLLTESLALSGAGAAVGLLVAQWGTQALLWAISYPDDPILLDLSWDLKLAAFAGCVTLACALLFGLAPAFAATRISLSSAMNSGATTGKRANRLTNSALVIVQVALSLAILVSAALLARTLQTLLAQNPGYDPKDVVTAQANWPGSRENPQRAELLGKQLLAAFRSLPGVTATSWSRTYSKTSLAQLAVLGPGGSERTSGSYLQFVSPDFYKTWRTPILAGREFSDTDTAASLPVAILSAELARVLFGKANPVGLRFRENDDTQPSHDYLVEVVGVAGDMQFRRPNDGPLPLLFRPVSQCGSSCSGVGDFQIRAVGPFAQTAKRLEEAAALVDPRLVLKCSPLSDMARGSVHRSLAMSSMAATFAVFVGLLAMIGVYGVTAHSVAQRTREIGIRMALGAERGNVLRMVLGEMMRLICIGITLGLAAVIPAVQLIRTAIWGVKPTDPLSIGFAISLMLVIAAAAAFLPARRAMRVDPLVALRYE